MKYIETIQVAYESPAIPANTTDVKAYLTATAKEVNEKAVKAYYEEVAASENPYSVMRENPLIHQVTFSYDGEIVTSEYKARKYALPSAFREYCEAQGVAFADEPRKAWHILYSAICKYLCASIRDTDSAPSIGKLYETALELVNAMYAGAVTFRKNDLRVLLSTILKKAKKDGQLSLKKVTPKDVEESFAFVLNKCGEYALDTAKVKEGKPEKQEAPAAPVDENKPAA